MTRTNQKGKKNQHKCQILEKVKKAEQSYQYKKNRNTQIYHVTYFSRMLKFETLNT